VLDEVPGKGEGKKKEAKFPVSAEGEKEKKDPAPCLAAE